MSTYESNGEQSPANRSYLTILYNWVTLHNKIDQMLVNNRNTIDIVMYKTNIRCLSQSEMTSNFFWNNQCELIFQIIYLQKHKNFNSSLTKLFRIFFTTFIIFVGFWIKFIFWMGSFILTFYILRNFKLSSWMLSTLSKCYQKLTKYYDAILYQCPIPQTRLNWEHWVMLNEGRSPDFNISSILTSVWADSSQNHKKK